MNSRGFTLVELLIAVAIIGIIAAIAIPQFAHYRKKFFNAAAESDLHHSRIILEAYYHDHYFYPSG